MKTRSGKALPEGHRRLFRQRRRRHPRRGAARADARGARIVICGAISQYNNTTPVKGPTNYLSLLVNRARMEGIVVFDYATRYRRGRRARWPAGCSRRQAETREDVVDGLETLSRNAAEALQGRELRQADLAGG